MAKKLRKARERLQARQASYEQTIRDPKIIQPLAFKRPGRLK